MKRDVLGGGQPPTGAGRRLSPTKYYQFAFRNSLHRISIRRLPTHIGGPLRDLNGRPLELDDNPL